MADANTLSSIQDLLEKIETSVTVLDAVAVGSFIAGIYNTLIQDGAYVSISGGLNLSAQVDMGNLIGGGFGAELTNEGFSAGVNLALLGSSLGLGVSYNDI